MSRSNIEYLKHAIDEIDFLEKQVLDITEDRFMRDELIQHAFTRSLEIIGEAVKQIPDEIRNKYSNIDWRSYAGFRDKLIHHYFGRAGWTGGNICRIYRGPSFWRTLVALTS